MAQPTPHLERDSSRQGWTPTKPDPMSIGTNRPMALVQTRREGLKQDSQTSIVCTSGGSSFWCLALLAWQSVSNTAGACAGACY